MDDTDRLEPSDSDATLQLMGNFYRGEVDRMTIWRTRLDQTTNWAVVFMAATLTFGFSSPESPHYVLLLGALGVLAFLTIESQRYQEYDTWRNRVRLLQRNLMADVIDPGELSDEDWKGELGADLRQPEIDYANWRALAHRLENVYFAMLSVLFAAWVLRVTAFEPEPWQETASVGGVPGPAILGLVGAVYLALAVIAAWSARDAKKLEFSEPSR